MSAILATTGQLLLHGPLRTGGEAEPLRGFLAGAAAFSNLEACVEAPGAWVTKTKTSHIASPAAIGSLRDVGLQALTHANNHAFDLGPPGLAATRDTVLAAGLAFCGSGADAAQALAPAWLPVAGGRLAVFAVDLGPQPDIACAGPGRPGIARLAIHRTVVVPPRLLVALREIDEGLGDSRRALARAAVGFDATAQDGLSLFGTRVVADDEADDGVRDRREADPEDLARLTAAMDAARAGGATLVAVVLHSHHWDPDWTRTPGWMLDLARGLVDAGADIVAGHGAPVLQGLVLHRGRPILAGLGNAVFHTRRAETYRREGVDVFRGVAVRLAFSGRTCTGVEVLPIRVPEEAAEGPGAPPVPLAGPDAEAVMDRFTDGLCAAERAQVFRAG